MCNTIWLIIFFIKKNLNEKFLNYEILKINKINN